MNITRSDLEEFIVKYHAEVWEAASDEDSRIPYDDAGRELSKEFLRKIEADTPAVVVPDDFDQYISEKLTSLSILRQVGHTKASELINQLRCIWDDSRAALAATPSHSQQSAQRISEQDAREICDSYWEFCTGHVVAKDAAVRAGQWMKQIGSELLVKLNADRCPSHESEQPAVCESVQTEPDRSGMYFYKNNDCAALHPQSPDCKCWYKYGTGPLSNMKSESEQGGAA